MALIRASVGFLVLFLAFAFKSSGAPLWYLVVAGRHGPGRRAGRRGARLPACARPPTRAASWPARWWSPRPGRPGVRLHRRAGRRRDHVVRAGDHVGHVQAGLRRPGAARRPRRQPGAVVRPVRDPLPAGLGHRRLHAGGGPLPRGDRLPAHHRHGGGGLHLLPGGPAPGGPGHLRLGLAQPQADPLRAAARRRLAGRPRRAAHRPPPRRRTTPPPPPPPPPARRPAGPPATRRRPAVASRPRPRRGSHPRGSCPSRWSRTTRWSSRRRGPPDAVAQPEAAGAVEQPTLPLDFLEPDDDDTALDNTLFAEPRWREPGA